MQPNRKPTVHDDKVAARGEQSTLEKHRGRTMRYILLATDFQGNKHILPIPDIQVTRTQQTHTVETNNQTNENTPPWDGSQTTKGAQFGGKTNHGDSKA